MTTMEREYQKYEFCKDENCQDLINRGEKSEQCLIGDNSPCCGRTAKQFHEWLKANNFKIIKCEDD